MSPSRVSGLLLAVLFGIVALPVPAAATEFVVTTTGDPVPNGCTSTDCSLREAVIAANANLGADVITLGAGDHVLTRTPTSSAADDDEARIGDLDVLGDLTIRGSGVDTTTLSGAAGWRDAAFFDLPSSSSAGRVVLEDVTFSEGANISGSLLRVPRSGTAVIMRRTAVRMMTSPTVGAILLTGGGNDLTIVDSTLAGNQTFEDGAVIHSDQPQAATISLQNVLATDNDAEDGGIISVRGTQTDVEIIGGAYARNRALDGDDGGVITVATTASDVHLTIDSATFNGNTAGGSGGAIRFRPLGGTMTIADAIFTGNSALNLNPPGLDGLGGALFVRGPDIQIDISGSTFINNTAGYAGGAISFDSDGGSMTITESTFTDNTVNGMPVPVGVTRTGGAISASGSPAAVTIDASSLTDNESFGLGGAVDVFDRATIQITASALHDNSARNGGAVSATGSGDQLFVTGSSLTGNTATEAGGAVYTRGGAATIENSTIGDNEAAAGSAMSVNAGLLLRNATVAANTATSGAALLQRQSGLLQLQNTIIAENTGGAQCQLAGATASEGGNIDTDGSCGLGTDDRGDVDDAGLLPLSGAGVDRAFPLELTSPARNTGISNLLLEDQRGTSRPQGTALDSGAIEDEAAADLQLTKTGPATATTADVVRYELEVTNDGPDLAASVTVVDTLPAGTSIVSADPRCSLTATERVTCDLGDLDPATTASVTLGVALPTGSQTNEATVASAVAEDPSLSNNTDSATTEVSPAPPEPASVTRIAGGNRIATAALISQREFAADAAGAVVLARDDLFADALAGTPLAVQEHAPVLLTTPALLSEETAAEINRVLPDSGRVYLLGGEAALSATLERTLLSTGYDVVRLAGANRFATATAIARDGLDEIAGVYVADGGGFPDALAAGTAAGLVDGAVVLTDGGRLPDETAAFLDEIVSATPTAGADAEIDVFAVGGPASNAVPDAVPLVGQTRFETAIAVARSAVSNPTAVGVATGLDFPDALSGGAATARAGGPLLLTAPDALPDTVAAYLDELDGLRTVLLFGGTNAVATAVEDALRLRLD